jgi:hypothetical protein
LRKLLIGVAALVALAIPAIALAQNPAPVVTNDVKITPSKAGTSKKPAVAKFVFKVVNSSESKTTVKQIVLDLPKGVKLDGTKLDKCTADDLVNQGARACPSGSKLGSGVSYAFLVTPNPPPDCVGSNGTASGCITLASTFYVGGTKALTVGLVDRNTGDSFAPLTGKISNSGRRLTIDVPPSLQQPVPGTYSALSQLGGSFSRSKTVSGKKYSFVSTTSCPSSKKWVVKSKLVYAPNPIPAPGPKNASDSVSCKK